MIRVEMTERGGIEIVCESGREKEFCDGSLDRVLDSFVRERCGAFGGWREYIGAMCNAEPIDILPLHYMTEDLAWTRGNTYELEKFLNKMYALSRMELRVTLPTD